MWVVIAVPRRPRRALFCRRNSSSPTIHVLAKCDYWGSRRMALQRLVDWSDVAPQWEVALLILSIAPARQGFAEAVLWAKAIDMESAEWWRRQG